VILSDSFVCVPHDAAFRCEKSFERGSSSDIWLSSPFCLLELVVVVNGVVALLLSPWRSFTSLTTTVDEAVVLEVVVVVVVVDVVVIVVNIVVVVVVVTFVVVAVVVVVLVIVVVAAVVVVSVVVAVVVVSVFLNRIVDIVDLDILGLGNASVDIMLWVVEVGSVSILLSSISTSAVDVLVGACSVASTTTRDSAIATLQHTSGSESLKPQWFEKISLLAAAPPIPFLTCLRISSNLGHWVIRTQVVPAPHPDSSGIRWI